MCRVDKRFEGYIMASRNFISVQKMLWDWEGRQ